MTPILFGGRGDQNALYNLKYFIYIILNSLLKVTESKVILIKPDFRHDWVNEGELVARSELHCNPS